MLRSAIYPGLVLPCLLAACGGGGGGSAASNPARLRTGGLEFGPSATTAELVVSLTDLVEPLPVLMQVAIELPAALTIAPGEALRPRQNVPTLAGERGGNRYLVVCGDDRNADGVPLQAGELFTVRLATTTPRQIGIHEVLLRELVVAQSDGSPAAADDNPVAVSAIVQ